MQLFSFVSKLSEKVVSGKINYINSDISSTQCFISVTIFLLKREITVLKGRSSTFAVESLDPFLHLLKFEYPEGGKTRKQTHIYKQILKKNKQTGKTTLARTDLRTHTYTHAYTHAYTHSLTPTHT